MIRRVLQGFAALVGVWLMASPAILGYEGVAAANDRIVGPIAASVAILAMSDVLRSVRLANVGLGGWMAIAAFLLPYPDMAILTTLAAGIALVLLALPESTPKERFGGGWTALARGVDDE